ncbi:2-dehydropantoate 2-reductase-1 [Coleophoma crateriformis]|uniref:2-dehydropantoate 2-reductase n=1 Tax=Coleophoma crateriformis TaxID=565419 RepID=A0A3D8QY95_9HELO|nr:2-dehydropantoate 2-reductase-1 [Coleophoma crateriformis]
MSASKANVLLVGGGAVGAIAALNIEAGGLGAVTAVLRSNYPAVSQSGYNIESVDHGKLPSWKPTKVVNSVPAASESEPYDYVVCVTKNCPDIKPTLVDLITPAVTKGHTVIVLIQNGLNIERPLFEAFPENICLSGVSMIDSHEEEPGHILHEEADLLHLGAFRNPNLSAEKEKEAALAFIKIYSAAGKTKCPYNEDVPFARWRKLVFNSCLNPICAITGLDDARIRLAGAVEGLVKPACEEIIKVAKAKGIELPEGIADTMINLDPMDLYLKPSMQCDAEKGNYIEYENLVGEPLRDAEKIGVSTPILKVVYELCKAMQWKTMEAKGLVKVPPKRIL